MTGKPELWNDTTWGILKKFWAEGISSSEIGRRMGVSKNSICSQVRLRGLLKRRNPMIPMTIEQRQRILELVTQEVPATEIIRLTGASLKSIHGVIRKAGGVVPERLEHLSPVRIAPRPPPPPTLAALPSVAAPEIPAALSVVEEVEEIEAEESEEAEVEAEVEAEGEPWDFTEYEACQAREALNRRDRWQCRYMVSEKPWTRCPEQVRDAGTHYCGPHHKGCFTARV